MAITRFYISFPNSAESDDSAELFDVLRKECGPLLAAAVIVGRVSNL
jgi:hypothetical protein